MREKFHDGRLLAKPPNILCEIPTIQKLHCILKQARKHGAICPTGDIRHLVILMIGLCFIYFSYRLTGHQDIGPGLTFSSVQAEGLRLAQMTFLSELGLFLSQSSSGSPDAVSV